MAVEKVANGIVVAVAYTLTVEGNILDVVNPDQPLEYLHGAENIVPGLEKALTGKKVGDKLTVTLQPAEGFGEHDDDLVEAISREDFPDVDDLEVGMEVELETEDEEEIEAIIREITPDAVILDFNPPLSGEVLTYDVEVVGLRAATEDELELGFPASLLEEMDDEHDHNHEHEYE